MQECHPGALCRTRAVAERDCLQELATFAVTQLERKKLSTTPGCSNTKLEACMKEKRALEKTTKDLRQRNKDLKTAKKKLYCDKKQLHLQISKVTSRKQQLARRLKSISDKKLAHATKQQRKGARVVLMELSDLWGDRINLLERGCQQSFAGSELTRKLLSFESRLSCHLRSQKFAYLHSSVQESAGMSEKSLEAFLGGRQRADLVRAAEVRSSNGAQL